MVSLEQGFLRDNWKRMANEGVSSGRSAEQNSAVESPEVEEDKLALEAYLDMKMVAEGDDLALGLFNDVKKSLIRYIGSIRRLSKSVISEENEDEVAWLDEARRLSHNALIDNLNILSRYCHNQGLDKSWRNVIGTEREEIPKFPTEMQLNLIITTFGYFLNYTFFNEISYALAYQSDFLYLLLRVWKLP